MQVTDWRGNAYEGGSIYLMGIRETCFIYGGKPRLERDIYMYYAVLKKDVADFFEEFKEIGIVISFISEDIDVIEKFEEEGWLNYANS